MPKRVGFLYEQITSWSNLYLAYIRACKHKKSKAETTEWMYNCERYLFDLQAELVEERYHPQPYKYFLIREPKERIISVAAFRDRVVHHALVNIIEPYFEASFIKDSYATRKEKGLHLAVKAAQNYTCHYKWYLKLDIRKYFASINHEILLKLINRKIKDPAVMSLCRIILSNQTASMGLEEKKGLPVGNLTSQFFANIYLNQLDHFVKQALGFHAYLRYMDDFILFSNDPQDIKQALKQIEIFVLEQLDLFIKPKSMQINRVDQGIPYLGYRIFPKLLRIRRENLKRCLKGIGKTEQAYLQDKIGAEVLYQSTRSRMGFIGYASSSMLIKSIWGRDQQAGPTV
ncbi:MAG TPA: reverse transcriptase/maturase family protein [Candidatus Cloacimonadota bacterium]|nr:reverse transcriptase/maturase family protein [Candidatus Cloacimonadota bacterium]